MQDIIPPQQLKARAAAKAAANKPIPTQSVPAKAQAEPVGEAPDSNPAKSPVAAPLATGGAIKPVWYRRAATGLLVVLSLVVIMMANFVCWLNRAIVNKNGFVATTGNLVDNPIVQKKLVAGITDKLLDSTQPQELAAKLLPNANPSATDDQLKTELKPVIKSSLDTAVKSPQFGSAWRAAAETIHDTATGNSATSTVNLQPIMGTVLDSLTGTPLAFIADEHRKEVLDGDAGKIKIENPEVLTRIQSAASTLKALRVWLAIAVVVFVGLAILTSPYRFKTLRKIVLFAGIKLTTIAVLLWAIKPLIGRFAAGDARDLVTAVVPQLLRGLVMQSAIIGLLLLAAWLGLFILHRTKLSRIS